MYVDELFSGLDYGQFPKITVIENKMNVEEMVCVDKIDLTSTCEHHFVTIDGSAKVAYIHYCVKARGVKDGNSTTRTTSLGGVFKSNPSSRAEFLS